MTGIILVALVILWVLGYIHISFLPIPNFNLFTINHQQITLWNLLILGVLMWAISVLPSPLRQIAGVILILWILSTLGIVYITGLSSLLVLALIVGIIFSFLG